MAESGGAGLAGRGDRSSRRVGAVEHLSMLLAGAMAPERAWEWSRDGFRCSVRDADPAQWAALGELVAQGRAIAVRDAGYTEVAPGSMTVIAHP